MHVCLSLRLLVPVLSLGSDHSLTCAILHRPTCKTKTQIGSEAFLTRNSPYGFPLEASDRQRDVQHAAHRNGRSFSRAVRRISTGSLRPFVPLNLILILNFLSLLSRCSGSDDELHRRLHTHWHSFPRLTRIVRACAIRVQGEGQGGRTRRGRMGIAATLADGDLHNGDARIPG